MKFLILFLLISSIAIAQTIEKEKFLNKKTITSLTFMASGQITDAITTQYLLNRTYSSQYHVYESNSITRPFVTKGWGGQMIFTGLSFGVGTSMSYMAHRTKHHKLERAIPIIFGCGAWYAGVNNTKFYRLK